MRRRPAQRASEVPATVRAGYAHLAPLADQPAGTRLLPARLHLQARNAGALPLRQAAAQRVSAVRASGPGAAPTTLGALSPPTPPTVTPPKTQLDHNMPEVRISRKTQGATLTSALSAGAYLGPGPIVPALLETLSVAGLTDRGLGHVGAGLILLRLTWSAQGVPHAPDVPGEGARATPGGALAPAQYLPPAGARFLRAGDGGQQRHTETQTRIWISQTDGRGPERLPAGAHLSSQSALQTSAVSCGRGRCWHFWLDTTRRSLSRTQAARRRRSPLHREEGRLA